LKYIATALSVMLLIVVLSVVNSRYIQTKTESIVSELEDCMNSVDKQEYGAAQSRFAAAQEKWDRLFDYLAVMVHHDELDGIINAFSRSETQLQNGNYSEFSLETSSLICLLQSVIDSEYVNADNLL